MPACRSAALRTQQACKKNPECFTCADLTGTLGELLVDGPLPSSAQSSCSNQLLARYLRTYAATAGILPCIRCGAELQRAVWQPERASWSISFSQNGVEQDVEAGLLVVCRGHHSRPRVPVLPVRVPWSTPLHTLGTHGWRSGFSLSAGVRAAAATAGQHALGDASVRHACHWEVQP